LNSTRLQPLSRLLWAFTLSMLFLIAVGILRSDRLQGLVERPVTFIASLVAVGLSHGLASALLTATHCSRFLRGYHLACVDGVELVAIQLR
jgi:hypothetical protein